MFSEITKLFASPQRVKLIKLFALQPEHKYQAKDLTKLVNGGKARIQRELAALARIGILIERSGKGGRTYVWDESYELASAVRAFVGAATNITDAEIARAFRRIAGVECVLVAGVLVGEERSSVDVLVIGKKQSNGRIAEAIKHLEESSVIPLRYSLLDHKEFVERREAYDRHIRDILDFPYRVVMGKLPS